MFTSIPMITLSAAGASDNYFNRIVDANTMDNWQKYFDLENLNTANAGGVWTDKSVFKDTSAFNGKISMLDEGKNFITALSAIAANKEVVGYSTIPTDTVLVLDLSGSMENSNSESQLISATNNAITQLLKINENNRVGVVLYSAAGTTGSSTYEESVTRILPIDRYTTAKDGVYLNLNGDKVSVDKDVSGTGTGFVGKEKKFGGGTYIQAGLWEAKKMFEEMDTVIKDNNWQSGDNRMPILVLMSDGAPSTGTTYYDDVENSNYNGNKQTVYKSNVGNGNENNLTAGNAFLTQLTAAYVMNKIEGHYQKTDSNVRGLFYTLGFNIQNNAVARSVMNPDSSTLTDSLWEAYSKLTDGSLTINVKNRSGGYSDVSITKNSYVTSKSYVDEYFSASGNGLTDTFKSIVEEIILQSRYYPTHLEVGSPDFSGYVEFTDSIGEYIEIKHINGILLGDTLFDGHMMASKLSDTSDGGLGTVENPTDLGNEFINSVKTRLGISSTTEAQTLVAKAFDAGQLNYKSETEWSNFIGWYAKADGTYVGFWDENSTDAITDGAVYKIKSYGFLGETTGSIKNSDMMYMSVQVKTNILTGMQTLSWKIPASLVPLITYKVTLEGTNVDQATNVKLSVENATDISPIRLIFESGLRSDLNELNITRITDAKHIAEDGVTRQFWSNYFDISSSKHEDHITALSKFTPSKENERFYYTFDSAVHKKVGDNYVLLQESEGNNGALDANGEYYHRRYIFKDDSSTPVFFYEKMSADSISSAQWDKDFITMTNEVGAFVVPAGTPARELNMYSELKADEDATKSAHMIFYPYLTEQNNVFYVDMNLGNNGLLEVTPAQGIKISKTVDVYEADTSTDFSFRITVHNSDGTPFTGKLNSWITDLDVVPLSEPTEISFSNAGTYTADLSSDQTLWLTEIPTGAMYTVEEVSSNEDYKIKSVHVNGKSQGEIASGDVAAYLIDDIHFVNTAVGEGDLVITKQVTDSNGNTVDVADSIEFTAEVTLTNQSGGAVYGEFECSNGTITIPSTGKFTVKLKDGESFVIRNLPEQTRYSVEEKSIPSGFAFSAEESKLTGVIDATGNDQALIVNTYTPLATDGSDIDVQITKQISGNRTDWLNGESYTEAGTYYYRITESVGNRGGITYDIEERRFNVVVADSDMDGDLEIVSVNAESNTTVSGKYTVAASFNNVYQPTGSATATVNIKKAMTGNHSLSGYQFVLYDSADIANADAVAYSDLTDASGQAKIDLTYAANRATVEGATYTYYLAELNKGALIHNISYSQALYKVDITVKDNGDGTISATPVVTAVENALLDGNVPVFTNEYVPSASDYITISGKKTTTANRKINANEFEFVITALTENAPMPADTTVNNAADGTFRFDDIEFNDTHKGRSYVYKITESSTNAIGGFTYDQTEYTVTVTVTDNGDNTLTASSVINNGSSDVQNIVFHNPYHPTDAKVTLSGTKMLTGKKLQNGEFNFKLEAITQNAPMPSSETATNDENGAIKFGEIAYSEAGVYVYKLTEQAGTDSRYDYDESVYVVTVTVTDNSRGVLSAKVELSKNNMASGEIVFRNGFVPTPILYDIHTDFGGKKLLDGRPLVDGEFKFDLYETADDFEYDKDAVVQDDVVLTLEDDGTGKVSFMPMSFDTEGEFYYVIVEDEPDANGVTSDDTEYKVVITVTDNHKGDLIAEIAVNGTAIADSTLDAVKFLNSYKAAATEIVIKGTKTLNGRELSADEFSFELYDSDNTKLETVKNSADVSFAFKAIPIEQEGEYVYTVRELKENKENITYDDTVYTVKATVTDNLDGTFKVVYEYSKGTETADGITFINIYTAPKEEVVPDPTPTPETQPETVVPQTSDNSNLWLWFALMFVSGGGLVGAVTYGKKRKDSEAE